MTALLGVLSLFLALVLMIVSIVQGARKKSWKKYVPAYIVCLIIFVVCIVITPTPEDTDKNESNKSTSKSSTSMVDKKEPAEGTQSEITEKTTEEETTSTKSEAEKFAESNDTSVKLAESLETVLADMELTDKSRVGVFHYDLSDVYDWKQIEDWANGQRYSAYMAQEHIFYIYVKDDSVVGVRDAHGNVFYSDNN